MQRRRVSPNFIHKAFHGDTVGLHSYFVKDAYPIGDRIVFLYDAIMNEKDPFIKGLRTIFQITPDLKPAPVAVEAGLNNSTIRKLLSGNSASPKVETAQKIADAVGYPLSLIIELGSHPESKEISELVSRARGLQIDDYRELLSFVDFLHSREAADQRRHAGDLGELLTKNAI